jgi:alpha-D-ribose 1-methylphosphonate 5-phosphate C-P lyase
MVSKNNNKTLLATLALMVLSLSVASSIAISTPHYARAQGVTVEGGSGGNATNATMIGASNATNATMIGASNATNATMIGASNATNATMIGASNATNATSTGGGETAGGTQIGGPLSLYGGGGGQ